MKRIQCSKCKQVFWVELQIDEALVENGEWIQIPCPRCGSKWAMVKSGRRTPGESRRKKVRTTARRQQAGPPGEEKSRVFTPARILSLRKKLGLTQTQLGFLTGVDRGSILAWEKGKFKPKAEKAAQLADLATKGKEEVRKLLREKKAEQEAKSNPKHPKNRRRGVSQKAARAPKK
jgi:transcriptional regulator with XRE-family HTH domain/DNA-directed RNA polymerase subunit RPC12/RpoP